jgi:hypothetical protein
MLLFCSFTEGISVQARCMQMCNGSVTSQRDFKLNMLHCYVTLQVDPELVESHFLRPADQTIRQADIPERLQLLGRSVLEVRHMQAN